MPSEVLARTCKVTTRKEDPEKGFQRELDQKRADEIAAYIDQGLGTIPNSVVLSAQPEADFKVIGRGKTVEFTDRPGAFLILDGQHRVYGFAKAKKSLRVPVVIYNGLSRTEESRLFIDINTKQRPVPPALLLDIKRLADVESRSEATLREIFDLFDSDRGSILTGRLSRIDAARNKISRVTFNLAVKPLLERLPDRSSEEIFEILNNYLTALQSNLVTRFEDAVLGKPVVFRALMGVFPMVTQRVADKFGSHFSPENYNFFLQSLFHHFPKAKFEKPGTSWVSLKEYLESRLTKQQTF